MIARTQPDMEVHALQQEAERLLSPYTGLLSTVVKKLAEQEPAASMMNREDFGHNIRGRAAALAQGARLAKAEEGFNTDGSMNFKHPTVQRKAAARLRVSTSPKIGH